MSEGNGNHPRFCRKTELKGIFRLGHTPCIFHHTGIKQTLSFFRKTLCLKLYGPYSKSSLTPTWVGVGLYNTVQMKEIILGISDLNTLYTFVLYAIETLLQMLLIALFRGIEMEHSMSVSMSELLEYGPITPQRAVQWKSCIEWPSR